jgi:hypothetical protein
LSALPDLESCSGPEKEQKKKKEEQHGPALVAGILKVYLIAVII